MSRFKYEFDVEIIREEQPRRYADSEYEYIIHSSLSQHLVKEFCIHILKKPLFENGYTFEKLSETTYRYYVCIPYMD